MIIEFWIQCAHIWNHIILVRFCCCFNLSVQVTVHVKGERIVIDVCVWWFNLGLIFNHKNLLYTFYVDFMYKNLLRMYSTKNKNDTPLLSNFRQKWGLQSDLCLFVLCNRTNVCSKSAHTIIQTAELHDQDRKVTKNPQAQCLKLFLIAINSHWLQLKRHFKHK